ncbi:unnamed protein product [Pleuronectes platessa]|uniref:Uncharacterized protein n=1 Tax=Pleuronectes platessa TaxID=8262 RepID=A0A9N7W3T9_PLEPL|nr:unnamed protein product [Pleuronectes platessa]
MPQLRSPRPPAPPSHLLSPLFSLSTHLQDQVGAIRVRWYRDSPLDWRRHTRRPRLTVMNEPSILLIIRHSPAERGPLIKTSVGGVGVGGVPAFSNRNLLFFHSTTILSSSAVSRPDNTTLGRQQSVAPVDLDSGYRHRRGRENVVEIGQFGKLFL